MPEQPSQPKIRKSPLRVRKKPELPLDCPFTREMIKEMNRQHDRRQKCLPEWMVPAPPWFDKHPDDEDEQAFKLDTYHKDLSEKRHAQQIAQSLADQAKLQSLAPPPKPPVEPTEKSV